MATKGGVIGIAQASQLIVDDKNYDSWDLIMRTLLISQDLWEIVEEA